ncbi:MAG: uroporphyrinogen decarboxylase family protein [Clostridia bacterium]
MMTSKERLLSGIKGEETDRVPWSPFLAYFWESLPESVRNKGMLEFYKAIGADPLFRGFCTLLKVEYKNVEKKESVRGDQKQVVLETPVGDLVLLYTYAHESRTWFLTGHPVKEAEDYKKLIYLNENMVMEPDFSKYRAGLDYVGEEALLIPIISPEMKSSFQALVEKWVGTVNLSYHLYDHPEIVRECLQAMKRNSIKAAEMSCECGAEAYIFWEDSSTTNVSPSQFREHVADEIREWADILHRRGKYLVHHACGLIRDLIVPMCETGIDVIESVCPPPTGNITTGEARRMIPGNVGLIGGIDPTVLLDSPMEELLDYVSDVIEKTGKRGFILGNADSCPPGVDMEKFRRISSLVKNERNGSCWNFK